MFFAIRNYSFARLLLLLFLFFASVKRYVFQRPKHSKAFGRTVKRQKKEGKKIKNIGQMNFQISTFIDKTAVRQVISPYKQSCSLTGN